MSTGLLLPIPRVFSGTPGPAVAVVRAPVGRRASVLVGGAVVDGFVWEGWGRGNPGIPNPELQDPEPCPYTQFVGPEVRSRCVNPDGSVWEDAEGRVSAEPQEGWRREVRFVTHVPPKVSR